MLRAPLIRSALTVGFRPLPQTTPRWRGGSDLLPRGEQIEATAPQRAQHLQIRHAAALRSGPLPFSLQRDNQDDGACCLTKECSRADCSADLLAQHLFQGEPLVL